MAAALLLEIGCEELPTSFLDSALEQLQTVVPEELARARLAHGPLRLYGTPRRLAALVDAVADQVPPREEELLGPPESAARTPDGRWSKAAEGFARKCDVSPDALSLVDTPKGRYLRALKVHPGALASALLPEVLANTCRRITFAKSMRWSDGDTAFGRPVRWLLGLHGETVVPFTFAGLSSGRETFGHRFLSPGAVCVPHVGQYVSLLEAARVKVDPEARRRALLEGLEDLVAAEGGVLVSDGFLEREVLGLVEWPHALLGRFDPEFLALPEALITSVMRGHQRYFAARRVREGQLLPVFLTVCNTAREPGVIREGNERVLRARLKDAAFFVAQDRKVALGQRVPALDQVTFHAKLGTYGDKARRLGGLCAWVSSRVLGTREEDAARAGVLAKADLVTLTVGEFPELEGIFGGVQARHDGEPEVVARALEEQYQPRGAADAVPPSALGAVVALSDRVDTLVGCFAAGLRPSGSEDPFGLRRAVLGALRILLHHRVRLGWEALVAQALRGFTLEAITVTERARGTAAAARTDELTEAVREFAAERLRGLLEASHARDVVAACLAARRDEPLDVLERVEALGAFWATAPAQDLAVAFKRVFNITREAPEGEPDRALLTAPAEVALLASWEETRAELQALLAARSYGLALELLARALRAPVDRFFTEVFVMDPDPAVRAARLRLLGRIADAVSGIARFDALAELGEG